MESKAKLLDVSKDWKTGKFRITFELEKALTDEIISSLSGFLRLKVAKWREKRSLDANAYFHVLCQKIGEKTGTSLTEAKNRMIADYGQIDMDIHDVIMKDSIDWTRIQQLHLHPTTSTRVMDNGELYRVYLVMRGSHTYDTREMSRLIDGTVAEAKELGIDTATPDEIAHMQELWKAKYDREHSKDK